MIKSIKNNIVNTQPISHIPQPNSGQVVLMLVLITIVGLTIGLSLISRTVTDIKISTQMDQSGRAFSAAEAGIESALKSVVVGGQPSTVNLPDATGTYSIANIGGNTAPLTFPVTSPNNAQIVWLADHNTDGTLNETSGNYPPSSSLDICWGTNPNLKPAMVISLFYKSGSSYKIARSAYDRYPSDHPPSPSNNFDTNLEENAGGSVYCDGNYRFRKIITPQTDFGMGVADKLLFLRIRPVYENTIFAVRPISSLPTQSKVITSVGQTKNAGVVRKIQVIQGNNELPSIFDFALFAEN